tara:strand:+ start:190 stop:381 length:192 start_codon:yes stop_codon:yes gene_type:complete
MKTKQISFEQTNIELLNNKELKEIVGGSTSLAYDIGTLFRVAFFSQQDIGSAITSISVWSAYQ